MGAGWLCLRAHRFARRRAISRSSRRVVAARSPGSLSLRRMGGHAALEQRQGRHQRHFLRAEAEWPLARTRWTKYFLQPDGCKLGTDEPAIEPTLSYETTGEGLTFRMPAL